MSGRRTGSERAIAARLRRLDTAAGGRLVSDLWAARGYQTCHPGDDGAADSATGATDGVVTAARGTETVTLGVVSPPRFGSPRLPGPDIDVVVVLGSVASVTDRLDGAVRVLGAGDLAERLLYAVDRSVAVDLCERHLGAPPAQLRLPATAAVRGRLPSISLSLPTLGTGLRVAGFGLAALLLAVALAALGGPGVSEPATPGPGIDAASSGVGDPAGAAAAVSTEDDAEFPDTYPQGTADVLPPGVSQDGVDDAAVLDRAHSQRLEGRSYAFRLTRHQPAANGSTAPADPSVDRYLFRSLPQPGVTHSSMFAVAGDTYRSRATLRSDDGTTRRAGVYFTDGEWYVAAPLYGNTSFRSAPVSGSVGPLPETFRTEVVDRYLSTPETELTGTVERDGRRLYRIVATGTPRPFPSTFTRNYTAVALVDNRGVVHNLSASYDFVSGDNRATVETSVSYGSFGEVGVRPPPWYINRFDRE
ncbi:MAG: hypothetical protein ACI9HI_000006 [Salinirussus sp.]|jgi:hypothetical protein